MNRSHNSLKPRRRVAEVLAVAAGALSLSAAAAPVALASAHGKVPKHERLSPLQRLERMTENNIRRCHPSPFLKGTLSRAISATTPGGSVYVPEVVGGAESVTMQDYILNPLVDSATAKHQASHPGIQAGDYVGTVNSDPKTHQPHVTFHLVTNPADFRFDASLKSASPLDGSVLDTVLFAARSGGGFDLRRPLDGNFVPLNGQDNRPLQVGLAFNSQK